MANWGQTLNEIAIAFTSAYVYVLLFSDFSFIVVGF